MKNILFFLLLQFSMVFFQLFAQESVFLQSTQKGRGLLKSRSGECFVITPAHVVKGAVSKINITGYKNVLSEGNLVQELEGVDLAIVRIIGGGTQNCTTWSVPNNYTSILNNSVDAYLEIRENSGGSTLMQVFISAKDEEYIIITPKNDKTFIKGMSGSALFTQYNGKKVFLGMLQRVDEDGNGEVYQADDMERVLGGFFEENKSNPSTISMSSASLNASEMSVEEDGYRFDLMSVKKSGTTVVCKLKVTSLEKDGELKFAVAYAGSITKMYDQNGFETAASNIRLGSLSGKTWVGGNYTLVKNIPVPLIITFKDVSTNATGISYLKIKSNKFDVEFKNISLEAKSSNIKIPVFENSLYSNEIEGYNFDLINVKKSGTTIVCNLRVTSLEKDGELKFAVAYAGSITKMYDQNGFETAASNIRLGSLSGKTWVGGNYTLVKNIPVPLIITFKDVSTNATGISYLKIKSNKFDIEFKNISF